MLVIELASFETNCGDVSVPIWCLADNDEDANGAAAVATAVTGVHVSGLAGETATPQPESSTCCKMRTVRSVIQ